MTPNCDAKLEQTPTLWFQKWHEQLCEQLSLERSKVWQIVQ